MSTDVVEERQEIALPVVQAGLATRWKPGQSGNPAGRKSAGASVAEWYNALADAGDEEIARIARDKTAPVAKRAAARQWLQAISDRTTKVGLPLDGEALDRIADRTVGKPTQAVESRRTEDITVTQVNVDLAACLSHFEQYAVPKIAQAEPAKLPDPSV